jgi:hypothetical protein
MPQPSTHSLGDGAALRQPWAVGAQVYCIGLGSRGQEADPSKSFVERVRDHAPQVVSRSACTILDRGTGVRHDASSASALIFRVEAVRWTLDCRKRQTTMLTES